MHDIMCLYLHGSYSGKRIVDTIAEIESGQITANDLPQISVIQDGVGHYFCLNNRRLYVFKHLRRKGLLDNNTVTVRVKKAIPREMVKYSAEKCSLNCVLIREKAAWELDKEKEKEKELSEQEGITDQNGDMEEVTRTTTVPGTVSVPPASTSVPDNSLGAGAGAGAGAGGVAFKNNKKKLQAATEETDEERYLRQKQKIAAAKELYEQQAAERRQRKAEKEASQREAGGQNNDSESEEDDDEEEEKDDLFICNLCR